jgi:hypothetical protein
MTVLVKFAVSLLMSWDKLHFVRQRIRAKRAIREGSRDIRAESADGDIMENTTNNDRVNTMQRITHIPQTKWSDTYS